jgi:hypothetical protein
VSTSPPGLTVVLLPGTTTDPVALAATLASVRGEAGEDAAIVAVRPPADLDGEAFVAAAEVAAVPVVDPASVAGDAGLLAFVRAGDRWREDTLEHRRRPLAAHPTAVLSIAGHRRVGADDDAGVPVAAPLPPLDAASLLLRPSVEASAVLVRAAALDATAITLLQRPHGDAVLWSRLVERHGHLPSGEIAADVRLDPDRHGFRATAPRDAMLAAVADPDGDDERPGASMVRRELLRRLFVETDELTDVDLAGWLGPIAAESPRAVGVVADLQWALSRQREALVAERVRWPLGEVAEDDRVEIALDVEQARLTDAATAMGAELMVRDSMVRRLQAELAQRDGLIARLQGEAS